MLIIKLLIYLFIFIGTNPTVRPKFKTCRQTSYNFQDQQKKEMTVAIRFQTT